MGRSRDAIALQMWQWLYYPNYAYACSAVKIIAPFRIAEHACLLKDLTDQGCTLRTAPPPPKPQIGILLSYWGCPTT